MIRDKIAFYSNSEDLELRCYGCNIRSHLIQKCSKVHFKPDRDFIISRHLYSSPTVDRQKYYRGKREKHHTLLFYKSLEKISINFLNLNSAKETDHDYDTNEMEEEGTQQLIYPDSNEEKKVLKKRSEETISFLEDNENNKTSSLRCINEFNSNLSSNADKRINSFEKKEGLYNMNINMKYGRSSDITMPNYNNINTVYTNNNKNDMVKHVNELFSYDFDRVNSSLIYFPENNVEHVLSIIKMQRLVRAKRIKMITRQMSLNLMRFPLSARIILTKQNSKFNVSGGASPTMKDYGKLSFFDSMRFKKKIK